MGLTSADTVSGKLQLSSGSINTVKMVTQTSFISEEYLVGRVECCARELDIARVLGSHEDRARDHLHSSLHTLNLFYPNRHEREIRNYEQTLEVLR